MMTLSGITWKHRRAIEPLVAASAAYRGSTGIAVEWTVRSLGDFEHQPLHEAARTADLVVFDHPFCGVVAASGCFAPLTGRIADLSRADLFIGASLDSYRYHGELWGAPIDGACNHAVFRRDLLPNPEAVPGTWADVICLARELAPRGRRLALGANSHHGLIAVAALCANLGKTWPNGARIDFHPDPAALAEAIDALREVLAFAPAECLDWNSIAVHEAMMARDDLAYCPIVYGFAVYGTPAPALSFGPFPGIAQPHDRGGVIGGAAVGLSATCRDPEEALSYLAFLMQPDTQRDIFAAHSGQPARIEAWTDEAIDRRFAGYFSGVGPTLGKAVLRPRFVGYQQFEKRAGDRMEAMLRSAAPTTAIVAMIEAEADRIRRGDVEPPYDRLMAVEADSARRNPTHVR